MYGGVALLLLSVDFFSLVRSLVYVFLSLLPFTGFPVPPLCLECCCTASDRILPFSLLIFFALVSPLSSVLPSCNPFLSLLSGLRYLVEANKDDTSYGEYAKQPAPGGREKVKR